MEFSKIQLKLLDVPCPYCRCREKQRKETSRLQNWNSKLNAMNQLLLEENERLQKQATQLSSENQYLRQQLHVQQPNNIDANPRIINPVIIYRGKNFKVPLKFFFCYFPQMPCVSAISISAICQPPKQKGINQPYNFLFEDWLRVSKGIRKFRGVWQK